MPFIPIQKPKETSGVFTPSTPNSRYRPPEREVDENTEEHARLAGITCTDEHKKLMRSIFCDVDNVFITGGAGVGKTTTAKHLIINELNRRGLNFNVTASTGIAASHLTGRTLHSWAGIGLGPKWGHRKDARDITFPGRKGFDELTQRLGLQELTDTEKIARIKGEIPAKELSSMAIKEVWDETIHEWENGKFSFLVEGISARIRSCEVLIIDEVSMLSGSLLDYLNYFFKHVRKKDLPFGGMQLILIGDMLQLPPVTQSSVHGNDWAFKCESWQAANIKKHELTIVYRQDNHEFVDVLNTIRIGKELSKEQQTYLKKFVRTDLSIEEIAETTVLVPTNAYAATVNRAVLDVLPGDEYSVEADYDVPGRFSEDTAIRQLQKATIHHHELNLKVGSCVLMTKNCDEDGASYVNGSRAFISAIYENSIQVVLETELLSIGMSTSYSVITRNVGEAMQLGLSITIARVYTTRGNHEPFDEMDISPSGAKEPKWPRMLQYPVIPGYAITCHKSQGATMSKCTIDVSDAFAAGQAYVALSRLSSPDGLILSSEKIPIMADAEAIDYYERK